MTPPPSTLVLAVSKSFTPAQATEASMQRTWFVATGEAPRQTLAQPLWKLLLQQQKQQRQQHMPTVSETTDDSDFMPLPSQWSPPDGYQSSTSTQRSADATMNAELDEGEHELDDNDWDEYWRIMTEDIY